ncbi:hypothetical protein KP001_02315 [Geomonas subterranea]|uniref:Carboxypeptidase regulatory-like domain-containing protein n=1 Tax=Geomonas subterranea TaxID=2847989 RepID=A0ABX8LH89_9BACT|nr:hypothetical protein [Geomonas subterranea]QXE91400.1 hypothetical protein KP001_02315 [Geomonas subterranea]QXM10512.1 hypothetical protein KP002_05180 [Geomonas subterranea]
MSTAARLYPLFLLFILFLISGCGGSGSGAATTDVSGTVFAGPVTGATLVVKDPGGAVVAGPFTVSSSDGSFRVPVPTSSLRGALIFQATGGTYTDEATGTTGVPLGAFSAYAAPGAASAAPVTIDPASTIVQQLVARGSSLAAATRAFENAFGFTPDSSTAPAFANVSSSAATPSRLAGVHAAYFSQLTKDLALAPERQSELVAALADDLADGTLDGRVGSLAVSTSSGTVLPEDIAVRFAAAAVNYLSSQNNKSRLAADKIEAPVCGTISITASYRVEYLAPAGGDLAGKDTFRFKVTKRSDGSAATGLAYGVVLSPLMVMGTMSGATTWPNAVVETGTPGTYAGTVYYSMATSGMNMYWRLRIDIGSESAVFYPKVAALPAGNTVSAKLSNNADKVGAGNRTYRIWRDSLTPASDGRYDLKVFVSSTDAGYAQPVFPGQQWSAPQMSLTAVELAISGDGSNWTPLSAEGTSGRYVAAALSLAPGSTSRYYLRLRINGSTYTTNGGTPDGNANPTLSNGFASFSVTP